MFSTTVVEHVLNKVLAPFFRDTQSFGESQFGFQHGRSCNDLVATLTCEWVLALNDRKKVGVYLSDISGAFDKVDTNRMMQKLEAAGLNATYLRFFKSYLSTRRAIVLVNGEMSEVFELQNMVFQGTVLGPALWNIYFRDVQSAAETLGGKESKFADDLNVTKTFTADTPNDTIFQELHECQKCVHKWGVSNKVTFDETKE